MEPLTCEYPSADRAVAAVDCLYAQNSGCEARRTEEVSANCRDHFRTFLPKFGVGRETNWAHRPVTITTGTTWSLWSIWSSLNPSPPLMCQREKPAPTNKVTRPYNIYIYTNVAF